jgi:hypothetical protein
MPRKNEEEVIELTEREKLGAYYNLEGEDEELPTFIKDKVQDAEEDDGPRLLTASMTRINRSKKSTTNEGFFSSVGDLERSLEKLSPLDRQAMAEAVLNGTYKPAMIKPERKHRSGKQSAYSKMAEENEKYLGRHKLPKPQSLTVVSRSAEITFMNAKSMSMSKIDTIRRAPPNIVPIIERSKTRVTMDITDTISLDSKVLKNKAIENSRTKGINQGRAKASELATQAEKQKRAVAENVQSRKVLRGDIDKFRQIIRTHLIDNSKRKGVRIDIGAVMRCIDDAMLFEFMTTYSGNFHLCYCFPDAFLLLFSCCCFPAAFLLFACCFLVAFLLLS